MIPQLKININVMKDWTDDQRETVYKFVTPIKDLLPYYSYGEFAEFCVKEGLFEGFNCSVMTHNYGYANTRESIKKYLKQFDDDTTKNYLVVLNIMDREYEKYYKNGSYINHEGIDTETDYWRYVENHPEEENFIDTDCKKDNFWITFVLYEISNDYKDDK